MPIRSGQLSFSLSKPHFSLFITLLLALVFNQVVAQNGAFRITDYGAVGDGTTLTTQAIQAAIDAAAEVGGGRVIIPPGKYLTGGIELRDNIIFELQGGATLLGTESYADYRRITFSNCAVRAASRLFAIYGRDGATVEDVLVSNITGSTKAPLVLNRPIQLMIAKRTPESPVGHIRNVSIDQVSCETDGRILLTSIEPDHLSDIRIRDLHLRYPFVEDPTAPGTDIKSAQFPTTLPEVLTAKAAVVANNLSNFQLEGLTITWPKEDVPEGWRIPGCSVKRSIGPKTIR
jgi:hypothetical protein